MYHSSSSSHYNLIRFALFGKGQVMGELVMKRSFFFCVSLFLVPLVVCM
jgi:hypothetical protein